MTEISDYELRVLRQMVKHGDEDLICGAALWTALEALYARGLTEAKWSHEGPHTLWVEHSPTPAGRALVRERDAELTETKNG